MNLRNGSSKSIKPVPKEGTPAIRFNWDTPFAISHFDPTVLYMGGNQLFRLTARGDRLWGHRLYQAANPPAGAYIDYYLKSYALDEVSITIADSAGHEVAKLTGSRDPGLNRVAWDLQPKEAIRTAGPGDPTEYVAPGTYTVTLSAAGKTLKTTLQVMSAER